MKEDYFGIAPINKEQEELFEALDDDSKKVIAVTGKAGSGKSLVLGAYILEMLTSGEYSNIVFSKPMEIVGNSRYFGTVPGDADDKMSPFLMNFKYLFEKLSPNGSAMFEVFKKKDKLKFLPSELLRGISFPPGTIFWIDEAQNLSPHQVNTIGTRMEEGCKLFLSGDINQVDIESNKFESGLSRVVNSNIFKLSNLTSHIHLIDVERGEIAQLFTEIFEAK